MSSKWSIQIKTWPSLQYRNVSARVTQNRRWKLWQQGAICWNYLGLFIDHIFLRNKTFLFFKTESFEKEFSETITKFQLIQFIQKSFIFIELKFCEVLPNSFSNRKFQIFIFKNIKVLFLKKCIAQFHILYFQHH